MILAICANCSDQMYLKEINVKSIDENSFSHIYILSCENNHKIEVEGSKVTKHPGDKLLSKILQYLLENRSSTT